MKTFEYFPVLRPNIYSMLRFTEPPTVALPDTSQQFIVEVDASSTSGGVLLSQWVESDNKIHLHAFFSHCLSSVERNHGAGERELLAIKLTVEEWR